MATSCLTTLSRRTSWGALELDRQIHDCKEIWQAIVNLLSNRLIHHGSPVWHMHCLAATAVSYGTEVRSPEFLDVCASVPASLALTSARDVMRRWWIESQAGKKSLLWVRFQRFNAAIRS